MNIDTLYLVVEPGNRLGAKYWFRRKNDAIRFIARSRELYPHHPIGEATSAISRQYFKETYRGCIWVHSMNTIGYGWVADVFRNRSPNKAVCLVYHE